jgi:hypothetical protein
MKKHVLTGHLADARSETLELRQQLFEYPTTAPTESHSPVVWNISIKFEQLIEMNNINCRNINQDHNAGSSSV